MSRIAKGPTRTRCSQTQALAQDSQKWRSLVPLNGEPARRWKASGSGAFLGAERDFAMPHHIDIAHKHSRAIINVIGKELRASLKPEPEQPESLRAQLERLRDLESPLIVPADEHGGKGRALSSHADSEKYLELAEHYR